MKRAFFLLSLAFIVLGTALPTATSVALTDQEIMQRTRIVNLEAKPKRFAPNQPIDFVVTVQYDGGTQDGFDVAVYHENRLVGLVRNQRFNRGRNTFKVRDNQFKGDPGAYIVKLRFNGKVFARKKFSTMRECRYTLNPAPAPASTTRLRAPAQVSPANGKTFSHFPRKTTLDWKGVPGAKTYTVQLDCYGCCQGGKWCTAVGKEWKVERNLTQTRYTFNFVGAQPGRWRVWAVDSRGKAGPKSGWWKFTYTR